MLPNNCRLNRTTLAIWWSNRLRCQQSISKIISPVALWLPNQWYFNCLFPFLCYMYAISVRLSRRDRSIRLVLSLFCLCYARSCSFCTRLGLNIFYIFVVPLYLCYSYADIWIGMSFWRFYDSVAMACHAHAYNLNAATRAMDGGRERERERG